MPTIQESLDEFDAFSNSIVTMQEELSHHLKQASILSRKLLEAKEQLNENQSKVDHYSNDNLHVLELMSLDAVELVKVAVIQKRILNSRRLLKNGFNILYKNYKKYHSFLSLNLIEDGDYERTYFFRQPEVYEFASNFKSFERQKDTLVYDPSVNERKQVALKKVKNKDKQPTSPKPTHLSSPEPLTLIDRVDKEIALALQSIVPPTTTNNGHISFDKNISHNCVLNINSPFASRRFKVKTDMFSLSNASTDKDNFRYAIIKPSNLWLIKDTVTGQNQFETSSMKKLVHYLLTHQIEDLFFHDTLFNGFYHYIHQLFVGITQSEMPLSVVEMYLRKNFDFKKI